VSVESQADSDTESEPLPTVHAEHEPELPHSPLDLHSWTLLIESQAPAWQAATAESEEDCPIPRQQTCPASQSALETHATEMHAPSPLHAEPSDASGAASYPLTSRFMKS
jgi:hypothetical protein